jgi:uncharacterized membrane protein YcaP (DUF421 family)
MDTFLQIDWRSIFVPTLRVAEIFLRGTIVYLFLFFILRILRRESGAIGISDLLLIVLIADASQNAMSSDYKSVTDGIILVSTIAFWDYLLDWIAYRFPSARRLLRAAPLVLIKDGRLQRRNMRREMITEEELMGRLREQGIEKVEDVKKCYLEGDGSVSVIKKNSRDDKRERPKRLAY